jgi:hypothetical protein
MENNMNPEENENQINQRDWFKASLIFAKTLGFLLQEDEGVVINLNEMTKIEGQDDVNKVIVFKKENQVHIAPCEQDIPEGGFVQLGPEPEDGETNNEVVDLSLIHI